ncbi:MAG: CAAX protease [Calothrix sp. C42_A2020_038]|nr:CAAX protease [Calothrix sp. C42_A2020_038]
MSQNTKHVVKLIGLAVVALVGVLAIFQFKPVLDGIYVTLTSTFDITLNLAVIALIAIILAAMLAPLEALGWWAGWFGDSVNTIAELKAEQTQSSNTSPQISHYIIYLDGVGQAKYEYLPDVERFLRDLTVALPENICLIRGVMPYSVVNRSLTTDYPLSWFWQFADRLRIKNPANILGAIINIRNTLVVLVSADQRYGTIYNRGTAQVIYNSLIQNGYQPGSNVPITLIGFSGGGQISMAAAPYLDDALFSPPIDIISLGGVFSGNNNILKIGQIYHLAGEKDFLERLGAIVFPKRWKLFFLSYWNRAKRRGKVSLISLGQVGHELPGGLMDPERFLPDGRTYLQQTIDWVVGILQETVPLKVLPPPQKESNYERYWQATFNRPEFYPLHQSLPPEYVPIAPWTGRLILPPKNERRTIKDVLFEVHHTPPEYEHLVGQVVQLQWSDIQELQVDVRFVKKDVHFNGEAEYSTQQGIIHPTRINHWRLVNPLESLAGSHPYDDVMVMLDDPILMKIGNQHYLCIGREPVQITGLYYGLVQFIEPVENDLFRVVHYNPNSREFDGVEEVLSMPSVVADRNGVHPSTNLDIEKSPLNRTGWYIYGAYNNSKQFVVRSLAPRALLQLKPQRQIIGKSPVKHYLKKESWSNLIQQRGNINSVLLGYDSASIQNEQSWQEGDRALVLHNYGGIGGKKAEPEAKGPVYFGHFAYGIATVIREPLTGELRFDIVYHQIYTHNTDGLIAGSLHWSRYMGDRQYGWAGVRPVCDILVKFAPFTGQFETTQGTIYSPLDRMIRQLEIMAARYRIGDGTGGTFVGAANNCSQDSNQALYAALKQITQTIRSDSLVDQWIEQCPDQANNLTLLETLSKKLKRQLLPLGTRADWQKPGKSLGSSLEDDPIKNLITGLLSWRAILPRLASDTVVETFLKLGATAWVLRTNQIGGFDPDIEPVAPITF